LFVIILVYYFTPEKLANKTSSKLHGCQRLSSTNSLRLNNYSTKMQAQSEKVGDIFSTMKQTYNDKKEDGLEEIAKEIKEYQDAVRGKADFALDAFTRDGRMAMGRSTTAMSRRPNLWQDLLWPCDRRLKCHLRHLRCMILKDIPTVIHRSLLRLGKLGGFGPFFDFCKSAPKTGALNTLNEPSFLGMGGGYYCPKCMPW
jgi:hypothetical protein